MCKKEEMGVKPKKKKKQNKQFFANNWTEIGCLSAGQTFKTLDFFVP